MADDGARQKPISPDWLCHSLDEILEDNAIVLGEVVTNAAALWRQLRRTRPGTYFQSGGSNLGWGLGAALGARLASPDKTVVLLAGDGSFVFGCPTAALWAASTCGAPFLCIILNNMQYTAPKLAVKKSFGEASYSVKTGNWVGTEIRPSPDYAATARACLAYGQTVEEPADVKPAIKAALEQVRGGRPAVLDVRIKGQ
jgi:acetolactate synthase-1/2/3 large subunit